MTCLHLGLSKRRRCIRVSGVVRNAAALEVSHAMADLSHAASTSDWLGFLRCDECHPFAVFYNDGAAALRDARIAREAFELGP